MKISITAVIVPLFLHCGSSPEPTFVPTFQRWAQEALGLWDIGLRVDLFRTERSSAIMNWITVAEDDCIAEGVDEAFEGDSCILRGSAVGITDIDFDRNTGEILATTAIMKKSYLEGEASEDEKRAIFVHEIGHCLGLRHPDESNPAAFVFPQPCDGSVTNCVMHSSITPAATAPHEAELTSIRNAYTPLSDPVLPHRSRFSTIRAENRTTVLRQHSFPEFYISGTIGRAARRTEHKTAPNPPGTTVRRIYIMHSNGREDIHTLYPDGSADLQVHDKNE